MGLKFSSFAIRGIDVSIYNIATDWQTVPHVSNFSVIRAVYSDIHIIK